MKIPARPLAFDELIRRHAARFPIVLREAANDPAPRGRWRHWDTVRHLQPPAGLTHEEWWLGIKLARRGMLESLPLVDLHGVPFQMATPDPALQMFHEIDRDAAGELKSAGQPITNPDTRNYYLVNSL